ncbi:MAG TPA: M90 family metallopeptidase [Acidimicrobiales bacterium]|nr:M90 family metallopeptidase [Acidimicrobiales bacterium]
MARPGHRAGLRHWGGAADTTTPAPRADRAVSWWRRARPGLPDGWTGIVERSVAHWQLLDDDERARLADLMEELLTTKRWEAAHGFSLTDEIRTVLAAQASLLVLELGLGLYDDIGAIIVHPTTMTRHTRGYPGPAGTVIDGALPLLGQTQHRGPILLAWDTARANARRPEWGHDVVLHEFAHVLDLIDHVADGTPPLPEDVPRDRWIEVWSRELVALRAGVGCRLLSAYAATNPGEMFAVATEVFFCRPVELQADRPQLYALLRAYYGQDPAVRARRSRAGSPPSRPHRPPPVRPRR